MKIFYTFVIAILLMNLLTRKGTAMQSQTKESYIKVNGYDMFMKIVGSGAKEPIVFLHGGPGAPSAYLRPFEQMCKDRKLVFFDQIGCGKSQANLDLQKLDIDFFVNQVEAVRKEINADKIILYGQSWGALLAVEYYLKYPEHISKLILSSPLISTELWTKDAEYLISKLPQEHQIAINNATQSDDFSSSDYQNAVTFFYERYVSSKLPWSDDINETFAGFCTELYNYMWGPSEFNATGFLKNYSRLEDLSKISVPVLFIAGENDEVTQETLNIYRRKVAEAVIRINPGAAHLTMQDNTDFDLYVIREFLNCK